MLTALRIKKGLNTRLAANLELDRINHLLIDCHEFQALLPVLSAH